MRHASAGLVEREDTRPALDGFLFILAMFSGKKKAETPEWLEGTFAMKWPECSGQ